MWRLHKSGFARGAGGGDRLPRPLQSARRLASQFGVMRACFPSLPIGGAPVPFVALLRSSANPRQALAGFACFAAFSRSTAQNVAPLGWRLRACGTWGGRACVCASPRLVCVPSITVVYHPTPPPAQRALIVRETCAFVRRGGSKVPPFPRPASARCASLPCPRLLAGGAGGRVPSCRRWGSRLYLAHRSQIALAWSGVVWV